MATIKEMFEGNTAGVNTATELLKVLGDREGQFVWKKFEVETVGVENPTFTISGSAGTGATVTSDSVDLSLIDETFFDGFMNDAENRWFFYDENGLHYYNGTSNYDAVWDNVSCTMKLLNNTASFSGTTFHYTGTKTVYRRAEEGITVEYAVADNENSYPDGGTQDGFYYVKFDPLTAIAENIREGVDIFGVIGTLVAGVPFPPKCTKYAITEFTPSSRIGINTSISHGLDEKPKLMFVVTTGVAKSMYNLEAWLSYDYDADGTGLALGVFYNEYGIASSKIQTTSTNTNVSTNDSYIKYVSGQTYTVIAMA